MITLYLPSLYEAATMESISRDFIRKLVYEGKSHEEISEILKTTYPSIIRGLSGVSEDFV